MRTAVRAMTALALALAACGPPAPPRPSVLDPGLSEVELRRALGVPEHAERVLVLGQSSHLDINWHVTFDTYYETLVEPILVDATALLDAEPAAYYAVAEMAFVAEHLAHHDGERWRRHAASGRMRVVGGAMTTPDTLLTTGETLARDYLLGSLVAERELGVRTRTAWLPDSFGHAPTVPDVLAAAGYTAVGFGRADGARHAYEVEVDGLEPIAPGIDSTAAMLRDLGSADFVWRGPGGGEVFAHYMPVRQYCHGDAIDLDGVTFAGSRLGVEHDDDPAFVRERIAGFIDELTPYQRTPYLFVPVGCDFQRPRPRLVEYARWWNEERFEATGVWVAIATFEDYIRLVGFHRDVLPALERDITPVWTGFFASRPRIKRVARVAAEALAGVEPFLAFVRPGSEALAPAWHDVVLANHHDWITGTSTDAVTADEQLPRLEAALAVADAAWRDVLDALAARLDTRDLPAGVAVTVVNPGPVDRTDVVELDAALTGPLVARAGATRSPAQVVAPGRVALVAAAVPAFGWRTFVLEPGAQAGATAALDGATPTLSTGRLVARFAREADGVALASLALDGEELLAGASLEWIVYADSGGLYRIGSERPDCHDAVFTEIARVRPQALELVEAGPARAVVRARAIVDGRELALELVATAGAERLLVRARGSAAVDRTIALRVRPAAAEASLAMGVAGGVAIRPLAHHYTPSLWPAVSWVARGALAVALGRSTAVHGSADGALEWVAFRNAPTETPCDNVGPRGTDDGESLLEVALGRRDAAGDGSAELVASLALARPLRAVPVTSHGGDLRAEDRLVAVEGEGAIVTALKPASRGVGFVLHVERPGPGPARLIVRRGLLPWDRVSRVDLLELDDVPAGAVTAAGVELALDRALTAVRLSEAR